MILSAKPAAKGALTVSTGNTDTGNPSGDMLVADLDESVDGNSSAEVTLSRVSADFGDEKAFKNMFFFSLV